MKGFLLTVALSSDDIVRLRASFPALKKEVNGRQAIFFDGPAGTQVPQSVMDAICHYFTHCNANRDGLFATSIESDQLMLEAHQAAADFIGASDPRAVAFGANMTTLTFALSRALARTWQAGDEIVLSHLEHDANFSPWRLAAEDAGATVRYVDIDPETCTLKVDDYASVLNSRTRLVAVGCASNAVGTVNPVKQICAWAKEAGAISFLDAVHYAPHDLIDVEEWGCDFLICSAYKFFGPHVGLMYGRAELLESIQPYKLRPSSDEYPDRWMTGTQNLECIHGTRAAIDYIADLGRTQDAGLCRRDAIRMAFSRIRAYERGLLDQMLCGLSELPQVKIWGITREEDRNQRFPTVAITSTKMTPHDISTRLANAGIFTWSGNYYALPVTERLGLEPDGMVRIGMVHYNTPEEVECLLSELAAILN